MKQKLFKKLNEVNWLLNFDSNKELELDYEMNYYQRGWQLTLDSKCIYDRVSGEAMIAFLDGLIEADKLNSQRLRSKQ
jgi:hypothetical protein